MKKLLFIIPALIFAVGLRSQKVTDLSTQTRSSIQQKEAILNNNTNPNAILAGGGAFYISNPAPLYKVDVEKAYVDPHFQDLQVILVDGQEHTLPGRVRLIDQKVEVEMEDGVYELDNRMIKAIVDTKGRVYVPGFDPTGRIKGTQLYEVAFAGRENRLLIHHAAEWQDPPPQTMFDTQEQRRTLKSVDRVYVVGNNTGAEIKRMNDLLKFLRLGKETDAGRYVKRQRLQNEIADYALLLKFVEEQL